jgi:hypothetical protein
MVARSLRLGAHVTLFALAFVLFYVGLGLGLQYDPTLGTICWVGSGLLVAGNVFWISRVRRRADND